MKCLVSNWVLVLCPLADLENVFFSPQSQSVIKGQDLFFQCVSGDSSPTAHISWLKNSRVFTRGTQIQVEQISVNTQGARIIAICRFSIFSMSRIAIHSWSIRCHYKILLLGHKNTIEIRVTMLKILGSLSNVIVGYICVLAAGEIKVVSRP